jgi:hypothetical protein
VSLRIAQTIHSSEKSGAKETAQPEASSRNPSVWRVL